MSHSPGGTWTLVQSANAFTFSGPANPFPVAFTNPNASGNLIVLKINFNSTGTNTCPVVTSISDSNGQTYITKPTLVQYDHTNALISAIYYVYNCAVGPSTGGNTISVGWGGGSGAGTPTVTVAYLVAEEWSNSNGPVTVDPFVCANYSVQGTDSTDPAPQVLLPAFSVGQTVEFPSTGDLVLVWGGSGQSGNGVNAVGTVNGQPETQIQNPNAWNMAAYALCTTPGQLTCTLGLNNNSSWNIQAVAFRFGGATNNLPYPAQTAAVGVISGNPQVLTFQQPTLAGGLIVVYINNISALSGANPVTDTAGNTYVAVSSSIDFIYIAYNCLAYSTNTGTTAAPIYNQVSIAFTSNTTNYCAASEYRNILATANPFDQQNAGNATSATASTGSVTTNWPNELIVGFFNTSNKFQPTFGTVWSYRDAPSNIELLEDAILAVPGAITATVPLAGSDPWNANIVTFRGIALLVTTQPSNASVLVGQTATFTTAATSSGGTLTYQWQVNGVNVSGGSGATTVSYTTVAAQINMDQGQYTCLITDSNGTTSTNIATLSVAWPQPGAGLVTRPEGALPIASLPQAQASFALFEDAVWNNPGTFETSSGLVTANASEDFVPPATTFALFEDSGSLAFPIAPPDFILTSSSENFVPQATSFALDETGSFLATPVDDTPPSRLPFPEDLFGNLPLEEAGAFQALPPDLVLSFQTTSEEFAGAHPTEETGTFIAFVLDVPWITAPVPAEDFAGSFPVDESGAWTAPLGNNATPYAPVIPEIFVQSLPVDETGAWVAPFGGDDAAPYAPVIPEVFVQSLPVDETGAWSAPTADDLFPFTPSVSEPFAGSLPLEEPPSFVVTLLQDVWVTAPVPEDFVGYLPLDETSTWSTPGVDDLFPFVPPSSEAFAGSLPLEEPGAWMSPAADDLPPFALVVPEVFVQSLPLDEPSAFVPTFLDLLSFVQTVGEDFSGSFPLDEPSAFVPTSLDDLPPFALVVPEVFVQSLPLDEPSTFVPTSLDDLLPFAPVPSEDLPVAVLLVDETGAWTAPVEADVPPYTPVAGEELTVATFALDETGTWFAPVVAPAKTSWTTSEELPVSITFGLDEAGLWTAPVPPSVTIRWPQTEELPVSITFGLDEAGLWTAPVPPSVTIRWPQAEDLPTTLVDEAGLWTAPVVSPVTVRWPVPEEPPTTLVAVDETSAWAAPVLPPVTVRWPVPEESPPTIVTFGLDEPPGLAWIGPPDTFPAFPPSEEFPVTPTPPPPPPPPPPIPPRGYPMGSGGGGGGSGGPVGACWWEKLPPLDWRPTWMREAMGAADPLSAPESFPWARPDPYAEPDTRGEPIFVLVPGDNAPRLEDLEQRLHDLEVRAGDTPGKETIVVLDPGAAYAGVGQAPALSNEERLRLLDDVLQGLPTVSNDQANALMAESATARRWLWLAVGAAVLAAGLAIGVLLSQPRLKVEVDPDPKEPPPEENPRHPRARKRRIRR
jgi:hypothetical protein